MTKSRTTRIDWQAARDRLHSTQQALEHSATVDESRMRDIFRRRAAQLAEAGERQSADERTPMLAFRLGSERYGLELRHVAQVISGTPVTPVPGAPRTLAGVANLRGEVRSVLDARQRLGLPEHDGNTEQTILLLKHGERRVGLRVDKVDGIVRIIVRELNRQQARAEGEQSCIDGVTSENLIVLNVEALFDRGPISREYSSAGGR